MFSKHLEKFKNGVKGLGVLIDPDKYSDDQLAMIFSDEFNDVLDLVLVGGSLVNGNSIDELALAIKNCTKLPIILFPGSPLQVSDKVDAMLMLSLISGRNSEYLIGNHVIAAPYIKKAGVKVIPTGYMLIDGGVETTASYISGSKPIPNHKPQIAAATALAGTYLGFKVLYMDCGSGAAEPVSVQMVKAVKSVIDIPLIIGGGVKTPEQLDELYQAGADLVIVGTAIEANASLLGEFAEVKKKFR